MPDWSISIRERLRGLGLDAGTEHEVVEELVQHLEDRYRAQLAQGASDADAEVAAWRELDQDDAFARTIVRERRMPASAPLPPPVSAGPGGALRGFRDDVKFAWRRLRHSPGYTLTALLTVMLTVGANTAILSVADAILFRPLPYQSPGDIAIIQMFNRQRGAKFTRVDYTFLHSIDAACPSVSSVALLEGYSRTPRPVFETPAGTQPVQTMEATPNYFELLGVTPAAGRIFSTADTGGAGTLAMLTHRAWQQMFAADPSVVGSWVTFGPAKFQIVGVLPQGFIFPNVFERRSALIVMREPLRPGDKGGTFHPIVRIASGVPREQAQAEVEAAVAGVTTNQTVPLLDDVRAVLYPVGQPTMRYLLAAAVFTLLLGCANLATLMLLRGRRHMHDTAVRLALGASRFRLVRPMVIEAVGLGVGGAVLATALTAVTFDLLLAQVPEAAYGRAPVGVSTRVVITSLALGLLGGLAFSVVPAWRTSGLPVLSVMRRRTGRVTRMRSGSPLLIAQVAITVAVLFGAAIGTKAFVDVLRTPLGFSSDRVIEILVSPPPGPTRNVFFEDVFRVLASRPDITSAGAAAMAPFSRSRPYSGTKQREAGIVHLFPGYFETLDVAPLAGRLLTWDDARTEPAGALVSQLAASALFAGRDALGQVFEDIEGNRFRVVGVVPDLKYGIALPPEPLTFVIPGPDARAGLYVYAKARDKNASTLERVRTDLRSIAGGNPVAEWWEDRIALDNAYRSPRFQALVLNTLALLALGLTTLGIFSVVAYLVAARTREMGVRLAIGASPGSLVGLMVRQALVPVTLGLVGGVLLARWGSQLAEAQLFDVDTGDARMLIIAALTVVIAAAVAAFLPARRATKINPTDVLRAE